MASIEIEYCVPCGMLDRAQRTQKALLDAFGERLDRVALVTGDNGVFRVAADGEIVFDAEDEGYDIDLIVDRVRDHAA
jgi:selenoprotein W-related protein